MMLLLFWLGAALATLVHFIASPGLAKAKERSYVGELSPLSFWLSFWLTLLLAHLFAWPVYLMMVHTRKVGFEDDELR